MPHIDKQALPELQHDLQVEVRHEVQPAAPELHPVMPPADSNDMSQVCIAESYSIL